MNKIIKHLGRTITPANLIGIILVAYGVAVIANMTGIAVIAV